MGDFDIIECGFNALDETMNFGTRNIAATDNLYEASTLAVLKCAEGPEGGVLSPHLNGAVCNGCIFFNIDCTFRIFKDQECSTISFHAKFDSVVDRFCVSSDQRFLLVCLRNGSLHLIDCTDEYEIVASTALGEDENDDNKLLELFFVEAFSNCGDFLVVTKTGKLYKVSVKENNTIEAKCDYDFNTKIKCASFQYPFLLVNGIKMSILDLETGLILSGEGHNLKKIFPADNNMFLGMDYEGYLYSICVVTLISFPLDNLIKYKDFLVTSDDLNDKKQITAITENESHQSSIRVLSYPDFSEIYSIKISNEVVLITPEHLNDESLYISKTVTENNRVSELRFHVVTETEAEQRLERLLRKQKFEEAENFAKLFHLSFEIIHKAKVQAIIDKSLCDSDDINVLIDLLDLIEDDEFKLRCCLDVESFCSHFSDVRRFLSYGCSLVPKKQSNMSLIEELQESVAYLMFRFDTFLALNRGAEPEMQAWLQFARCDLIDELKMRLRNYQIEGANIIYNRLDKLTTEKLTESQILDVLNILNSMPVAIFQPFLPIFFRITLSILPSSLSLFVKWTYSKVCSLEKRAKLQFPDNAIEFAESVVKLLKVGNTADVSFQRQCMLHRQSFNTLSLLLTALRHLQTLKDDFRFTIPLNDFLSGPDKVVRTLLNIEMSQEEFDIFLKEFLSKFMLENHMEPNKVFLSEIEDLMSYEEQNWVNIVTPVLNCITSIQMKLQAVKLILETATVPWCPTVKKIAQNSLVYNHSLLADIRELIESEPIQIVLRRPKYEIKESRIINLDTLEFVINRIIYCEEPTMVEDVYQLCKTSNDRHVANKLLMKHFIRKGDLLKAAEILGNNTPEETHRCAEELFLVSQGMVNGEVKVSSDLRKNYYEIAPLLVSKLETNEFEKSCNEETLNFLKNVYSLKTVFQIETTSHDLRKNKNAVVEKKLNEICQDFKAGKRSIEELFTIWTKISNCVSMSSDDVFIEQCEKTGDYDVIFKTAKHLSKKDLSSKNLTRLTVLLLKYVGVYETQSLQDSYSESDSLSFIQPDAVVDNELFCQGLQLAGALIGEAVLKANKYEIQNCVEVLKWVNTSFYFTREENDLEKNLFGDIFHATSILPGFITFPFIKNVFNLCYDIRHTSTGAESPSGELLPKIQYLLNAVDSLGKEGQHFTAFRVVSTFRNSLMDMPNIKPVVLTFLSDVLKKKCIPRLLQSLLSNSVIDVDLLYNLLLSCDLDDAIKFIQTSMRMYKRHPRKFTCIIQTGLRFLDYHNLPGAGDMAKSLTTMKWWKKCGKKIGSYDAFFKAKSDVRFAMLIQSDCMDLELIEEYAKDYDMSPKIAYAYLFRETLQNWKPDYEIKTEIKSKSIIIKNNEEDLLKKCKNIMHCLGSSEILVTIKKIWPSLNPYYYEVFITLFNILAEQDPKQDNSKKLLMLAFLKDYQRVGKPSAREEQTWYSTFPEMQALDPLSEFRLPFNSQLLFTSAIWDLVRPEMSLKTYKIWFDVIEIVPEVLNVDDICSYVVKDVIASGILGGDSEEWVFYPKHEELFAEITDCVAHIVDLERATSAVYLLLGNTPNGADQVNAAKLCYKYALEYKRQNPNDSSVESAFVKVEKKYFGTCAMHILHKYQLAEEKYVNAIGNPNELILALYLDERILKNTESADLRCPDINRATEELAALFSLDIVNIRFTLINGWLSDSPRIAFDFDCSMIYTQSSSDDGYLKRAAYICCASEIDYWRTQLLKMGLGENEESSVTCKARALKVFSMITDVETIAELIHLSYDEFMNYIDKLMLISNLEYLGVELDVEGLDASNKKELLSSLAHRSGNLLSVKTMGSICMTYRIYELKYWEFIINGAIRFSMFDELKIYVDFLDGVKYHKKNFYVNAWQKLIDHLFATINCQEAQLNEILINHFLIIQTCPVVYSLRFAKVFRKCMGLGKVEFCAILLQYVNGEERNKFVEEILSCGDFRDALNNLSRSSLLGISHVQEILDNNR